VSGPGGGFYQHRIPRGVAGGVIDVFEAVQVTEEHGDFAPFAN